MKVRFTDEDLEKLNVLFSAELEHVPEVGHYVMSPTTAVHRVIGVIHVLEQGGEKHQIFCLTMLQRAAPEERIDLTPEL